MYWQAAGRQERNILTINNQKPYLQKKQKVKARSKVNEDIEIVNTEIRQTLSVIENLKKSSDEIGFRAEKRTALG